MKTYPEQGPIIYQTPTGAQLPSFSSFKRPLLRPPIFRWQLPPLHDELTEAIAFLTQFENISSPWTMHLPSSNRCSAAILLQLQASTVASRIFKWQLPPLHDELAEAIAFLTQFVTYPVRGPCIYQTPKGAQLSSFSSFKHPLLSPPIFRWQLPPLHDELTEAIAFLTQFENISSPGTMHLPSSNRCLAAILLQL